MPRRFGLNAVKYVVGRSPTSSAAKTRAGAQRSLSPRSAAGRRSMPRVAVLARIHAAPGHDRAAGWRPSRPLVGRTREARRALPTTRVVARKRRTPWLALPGAHATCRPTTIRAAEVATVSGRGAASVGREKREGAPRSPAANEARKLRIRGSPSRRALRVGGRRSSGGTGRPSGATIAGTGKRAQFRSATTRTGPVGKRGRSPLPVVIRYPHLEDCTSPASPAPNRSSAGPYCGSRLGTFVFWLALS